jgi:AcrR family transcriptional regulator
MSKTEKAKRLHAIDRRSQILTAAIQFFSDEGFDGSTRMLARRLGITQPLIYRYFPTKHELIRKVYETVFAGRWKNEWEGIIQDRTRPIRERIGAFYLNYIDVTFARTWMRIYLFSGLRGLQINRWWSKFVEEHLFRLLGDELRREFGLPPVTKLPLSPQELEMLWSFQGTLFYYGVRRDIYRTKVHLDFPDYLASTIDALLANARTIMRPGPPRANKPRRAPRRPRPPV